MTDLKAETPAEASAACSPNFFLIGAAKCGTTSVANYLDQHPEVFVSKPKEPNFFSFEPNCKPTCRGPANPELLYELLLKYSITSPAEYQNLFANAKQELAIGEASVRYLYTKQSAERIATYAPNARLLVLLRDPIDRLYSHYHMNVRQHIEPKCLIEAITAEDERIQQGWGWDRHYRRVGYYAEQLQRYLMHFDRAQLLVLFHSDLQQQPAATLQAIFRHLEVSTDCEPDFTRRAMVGHTPRWRMLRELIREDNFVKSTAKRFVPSSVRKSFVRWSESKNRQAIPPMSTVLRQQLRAQFAEDSEQLADILGRRLPW